jgi:predicted Rossmann fold nucleotide-binding protein DprA/Smf involved in DNA uptake
LGIVSGLARGIDAQAHLGTLDGGGYTCAVLGHGIDTVFPHSSRRVAQRIIEQGGALLTEYPPGVKPEPRFFPARNRIISGLVRGVVIVQAPKQSGALITADYALEQGRDVLVHRAGLTGNVGAGTQKLRDEGALAIESAAGILQGWERSNDAEQAERSERSGNGSGRNVASPPQGDQNAGSLETGRKQAELMELESAGQCGRHNGELYMSRFDSFD